MTGALLEICRKHKEDILKIFFTIKFRIWLTMFFTIIFSMFFAICLSICFSIYLSIYFTICYESIYFTIFFTTISSSVWTSASTYISPSAWARWTTTSNTLESYPYTTCYENCFYLLNTNFITKNKQKPPLSSRTMVVKKIIILLIYIENKSYLISYRATASATFGDVIASQFR